MRSQGKLFMVMAFLEVGAGLSLACLPALAICFFFGVREPSPEALMMGRLSGAGALAIGVACWLARDDPGSPSQRGLLWGVLIYNVGACAVLVTAGTLLRMSGIALWPAAVLHAALTIWCVANVRASSANS